MVVLTPVTPLPNHVETTDTPYEVLDRQMDTLTTQLEEIMSHLCCMAAIPAPGLGLPLESDDESTTYGSTVISQMVTCHHRVLFLVLYWNLHPLSKVLHPLWLHWMPKQLMIPWSIFPIPQGWRHRCTTLSSAIWLTAFSFPEDMIQLHSTQSYPKWLHQHCILFLVIHWNLHPLSKVPHPLWLHQMPK
jgi:hypothetical protein